MNPAVFPFQTLYPRLLTIVPASGHASASQAAVVGLI